MLVEALPVQEQPDLGGIFRPPFLLEGTVPIARSGELPVTFSTMVTEATLSVILTLKTESPTLSRFGKRGLRFRGARRGKRSGCRCVVRGGINHQCGDALTLHTSFVKISLD